MSTKEDSIMGGGIMQEVGEDGLRAASVGGAA